MNLAGSLNKVEQKAAENGWPVYVRRCSWDYLDSDAPNSLKWRTFRIEKDSHGRFIVFREGERGGIFARYSFNIIKSLFEDYFPLKDKHD